MYHHPHVKKSSFPRISAPICEESSALWHYFTGGEMFHEVSHWMDTNNTDASPIPSRRIFCLWNFKYILPLLLSCSSLQQKRFSWISTSFTNLTNAIAWHLLVKSVDSSTWREKLLFFSLLYPTFPAWCDAPPIHQLIYYFKVEPFHVIILYLVIAFYSFSVYMLALLVFLFWAIRFAVTK